MGSNSMVHVFSLDSSRPTSSRPSLAKNNEGTGVAIKKAGEDMSDLWPEREQVPVPQHWPPLQVTVHPPAATKGGGMLWRICLSIHRYKWACSVTDTAGSCFPRIHSGARIRLSYHQVRPAHSAPAALKKKLPVDMTHLRFWPVNTEINLWLSRILGIFD